MCCVIVDSDQLLVYSSHTITSYHDITILIETNLFDASDQVVVGLGPWQTEGSFRSSKKDSAWSKDWKTSGCHPTFSVQTIYRKRHLLTFKNLLNLIHFLLKVNFLLKLYFFSLYVPFFVATNFKHLRTSERVEGVQGADVLTSDRLTAMVFIFYLSIKKSTKL